MNAILPKDEPTRDKLDQITVSSEEVPFSFDELFFSRTNEKGIILAGNSVFQRVSIYEWDELLNKPHSIIRHPDMPRAVFWQLWDTIQQGRPIGAYVDNKAKDGRHYWVFAIITPIEGGYLSVRIKPSSALFQVVKPLYTELRALERKEKLKPEESAAILLKRLQEHGFRDYETFMSVAIGQEMAARDAALGRKEDTRIRHFDNLISSSKHLLKHSVNISEVYEMNKNVPLNLRVQAAHLGSIGAPMCVISDNYAVISTNIEADMGGFVGAGDLVARKVAEGLFLICVARAQKEVIELFEKDELNEGASREKEMEYLEAQREAYTEQASESLDVIVTQIKKFERACLEMKRLTTNLEITRVMGKIESSSIDSSMTNLNDLVDELGDFQEAVLKGLKEIHQANLMIQFDVEHLVKVNLDKH